MFASVGSCRNDQVIIVIRHTVAAFLFLFLKLYEAASSFFSVLVRMLVLRRVCLSYVMW